MLKSTRIALQITRDHTNTNTKFNEKRNSTHSIAQFITQEVFCRHDSLRDYGHINAANTKSSKQTEEFAVDLKINNCFGNIMKFSLIHSICLARFYCILRY